PYFILRLPRPPSSTLLPYTTLFRSQHPVDVKDDTRLSEAVGKGALMVNSTHHQAVDALGEDLRVSAVAPDGVIEAIESTRYPFVLGVQWHPEALITSVPTHLGILKRLIQKAREVHL